MTQIDYPMKGRCTCGEIVYQIETHPMFVHCCHCTWCQKETGSAFVLNVIIEAVQTTLLKGQPESRKIPSNSGKGQTLWQCQKCQTTVWSHYAGAGDKLNFVRAGTLDNPGLLPPDVHIFTQSKLDWVLIPEGVLTREEYYDRQQYWPAESLERYQAL